MILLLHDPSRVHDVPDDAQMLVLSGHVHGGQIGLLSLGTGLTILAGSKFPDFGLWGRGALRRYAHRGTGTFGNEFRYVPHLEFGQPGEYLTDRLTDEAWQKMLKANAQPGVAPWLKSIMSKARKIMPKAFEVYFGGC